MKCFLLNQSISYILQIGKDGEQSEDEEEPPEKVKGFYFEITFGIPMPLNHLLNFISTMSILKALIQIKQLKGIKFVRVSPGIDTSN